MANQILIQGAAQVAQAKHAGKLATAQGATKVAAHLSEGLSAVFQERNKEFTGIMKAALESNQGMSNEVYSAMYDKFRQMRGEFVYLNKKDRAMMLKNLSEYAAGMQDNENLKTDLANDLSDEDVVGETPSDDLGENSEDIKNIVTGSSNPVIIDGQNGHMMEDPNGEAFKGLTFSEAFARNRKQQQALHGNDYSKWTNFMWAGDKTGGELKEFHPFTTGDQENGAPNTGNKWDGKMWMPNQKIQALVNDNKVDQNSKQGVEGLLEGVINEASNLNPGDDFTFNKEKYSNLIKNNIIEKGKLRSLARHNIFGGRSFKKDLKEALRTNTYEDLGINLTEEQVAALDPTDNGKITRRDARVIWRAIRDDEDLLKQYLTGYYTNALEQNFNSHVSEDVKNYVPPKKDEKSSTQSPSNVNVDPNVKIDPNEAPLAPPGAPGTISILDAIKEDIRGGTIDENAVYTPGSDALELQLNETRNESDIVPFVSRYLPEGYSAAEAVAGLDYIKITAPNGASKKIQIGSGFESQVPSTSKDIVKQIDEFINETKGKSSNKSDNVSTSGGGLYENKPIGYTPGKI